MGISILACLGAVKLEMYAEKQLLHSGSKTKIQSLLEGTWAVLLGSWSRGEGGSGWEEKGWTGVGEGLLKLFFLQLGASWGGFLGAG